MPFRLLVNALSNQQIDSKYGETWLNLERFALSRSQPGLQCGDFQSYILRAPYNPALLGQPNLELIAQSLDIYIDDYKTMLPDHGTKWFKLNVLRQIVAEFPYFQNWTSALNQIAVARSWPDWANAAISSDEFSEATAQGREFNRLWDLDHWTIAAQKLSERLASA